jgi:hypothetical protein
VTSLRRTSSLLRLLLQLAVASIFLAACGQSERVSDPQLKPIQEMLDAKLPPGSPGTLVNQFVSTRGYTVEASGKPNTMVIIVRHIDQERLQPVTARVTFYFDSNDKLLSTEIVRTLNQVPQPQRSN